MIAVTALSVSFMQTVGIDGWMTCDFTFFSTTSFMSGRWAGGNERLCAMNSRLQLKISTPQTNFEPSIARSVGQNLTY